MNLNLVDDQLKFDQDWDEDDDEDDDYDDD